MTYGIKKKGPPAIKFFERIYCIVSCKEEEGRGDIKDQIHGKRLKIHK